MFFQDKNWLVTVALAHARAIAWIAGIAAALLLVATFLFKPVYKAQSVLSLDADFATVLRNIDIPYPAKTQGDYIRYEYFATHSVSLMSDPAIARQVIETMGLKTGSRPLKPEKFINPSLTDVLFSNSGQGVAVKWISDTQQFGITGYSHDPKQAVELSQTYADTFLKNNGRQYGETLKVIIGRAETQLAQYGREMEEIDRKMSALREQAGCSSPAAELELINKRVSALQTTIDERKYEESVYAARMNHLLEKQADFEKIRVAQQVFEANPIVLQIKKDMETYALSLAKASVDYTPLHPEFKVIESQLNNLQNQLKGEAEKTLSQEILKSPDALDTVLTDIVKYNIYHLTFNAALMQLESTIAAENKRAALLADIASKTTTLSAQKEGILVHYNAAKDVQATLTAIVDRALPAYRATAAPYINPNYLAYYKYFPRRKSLLLKCVLGVVLLASLFVVFRDLYAQTIHRGWQAEEVLPEVPCTEVSKTAPPHGASRVRGEMLPAWKAVSHARLVRLQFPDAEGNDLTLASALAALWQTQGRSTLVIDARLKYRHLTTAAGLEGEAGLADFWRGEAGFDCLASSCGLFPAKLIAAGRTADGELIIPTPGKVAELFCSAQAAADHVLYLEGLQDQDRPVLLEGMPEHELLVAIETGRATRSSLEALAREAGTPPRAVVLCGVPVTANLFTLEGLTQFLAHLITPPHFLRWKSGGASGR